MQKDKNQNSTNEMLNFFEEKLKNAERKKKFSAYGKLGGRPRKSDKKIHKFSISLNDKQNKKAKELCEQNQISLQELLRRKIENEPLPNPEKNKILLKSYSNFNRIKSFFNVGIWNESEREEFKKILSLTCDEILKSIKK